MSNLPAVPSGPGHIVKGVPLKNALGDEAVRQLAANMEYAWTEFPTEQFITEASAGIAPLEFMDRGRLIATTLHKYLPVPYSEAIRVLIKSMTPARVDVVDIGSSMHFYLPYGSFIAQYGVQEEDLETSIMALRELTLRYTAEFAIRPYFLEFEERMLEQMMVWIMDENPHVRRLCCEGTRPILPWGTRLPAFLEDPQKTLPILEALKDDEELYVRRSVANHLGDIAKKHPEWVFELCHKWLDEGASTELKWVIRHAVRYWAKKERSEALELRIKAK